MTWKMRSVLFLFFTFFVIVLLLMGDIEREINLLQSRQPAKRVLGAIKLGEMGPDAAQAVPHLIPLLEDTRAVRLRSGEMTTPAKEAANALVKIGEPAAEHLVEVLKKSRARWKGRKWARWALMTIKDSPTPKSGKPGSTGEEGETIPVAKPDKGEEDTSVDAVVMWRGFQQAWTHNHRMNRLGDYIGSQSIGNGKCTATLAHAAASGISTDTAAYTTYYYKISATDVGFQTGYKKFRLKGDEEEDIEKTIEVNVDADENMKKRSKYRVVLNGFDLCAVSDADKPKSLYIGVTNASCSSNKIQFNIKVKLNAACKSVECKDKKNVEYNMHVGYVIIAGESELYTKEREFAFRYEWDTSDEIFLETQRHNIKGNDSGDYKSAAVAFKEIDVELDREHWMLEWITAVRPVSYDGAQGKARYYFDLDLLFKQWTKGMKLGAIKKKGSAKIKASVVLMQFKNATVTPQKYTNSIRWEATGAGGCSSEARKTHPVEFDY